MDPDQEWLNYFLENAARIYAESADNERLDHLLTSFPFLNHRLRSHGAGALVSDFDHQRRPDLEPLRRCLVACAFLLDDEVDRLPTLLLGSFSGQREGLMARVTRTIADEMADARRPWLRPLAPTLYAPLSPLTRSFRFDGVEFESACISPDGAFAAAVGLPDSLVCIDLGAGRVVGKVELALQYEDFQIIAVDAKHCAVALQEGGLAIIDMTQCEVLQRIEPDSRSIELLARGRDGNSLLIAKRGTVERRRLPDLALLSVAHHEYEYVRCLEETARGMEVSFTILTPEFSHCVFHGVLGASTAWGPLNVHNDPVVATVLCRSGRWLAACSTDASITVSDIANGTEVFRLIGHEAGVYKLIAHPNRPWIISASADSFIRIWSLDTGKCIAVLSGHRGFLGAIDLSADGRWLVSADIFGTVAQWDLNQADQSTTHPQKRHPGEVTSFCATPDGEVVVSGDGKETVFFWWVPGPRHYLPKAVCLLGLGLPHQKRPAYSVRETRAFRHSLSPMFGITRLRMEGDHRVLAVSAECKVKLVKFNGAIHGMDIITRAVDSKVSDLIEAEELLIDACTVGKYLITLDQYGKVDAWDVKRGECAKSTVVLGNAVGLVPESRQVVWLVGTKGASRWHLSSDVTAVHRLDEGTVLGSRITKDGHRLIVQRNEQLVVICNHTKRRRAKGGASDSVSILAKADTAALCPLGNVLAWAEDGEVRVCLLNLPSRPILSIPIQAEVTALDFSPDGGTIYVGDHHGRVHFFELAGVTQ